MTINRTMGEHFPELAAVITCLLVLAVKNITDPVTLFFSALPLQITPVGCMEIIFYAILSAGTAWFLKTFLDHHKERITTFFKSKNKTE